MNHMAENSSLISLQQKTLRVARMHFVYVAAFVASVIAFDSWKLIAPEDVLGRWKVAAMMLVITTLVWYIVKAASPKNLTYNASVYALILMDLYVAAFLVYAERGMASRAVMLFAIPIIVSVVLRRASALFATASLATAVYSFVVIRYFVVNFNEGYKIELYTTLGFFIAIFFVLAGLLSVLLPDSSRKR